MNDVGRALREPALVASLPEPASGLRPAGDDPARDELLIHKVILAISSASVPHESATPGALESRSLSYYLGVGIDHFGHDYNRHEALLQKAARQAIVMIRDSGSARNGEDSEAG